MPKQPISLEIENDIVLLRTKGFSYKEIAGMVGVSGATTHRYARGIKISQEAVDRLINRRFMSKVISFNQWEKAKLFAKELLDNSSKRDIGLVLACLYWGEGNKGELSLINSDPEMIKLFVKSLCSIGVSSQDLIVSIRSYAGHNDRILVDFWSNICSIAPERIKSIYHLQGKKKGKLKYGMCRVRVKKGGYYFKVIMSLIDLLKQGNLLP